MPSIKTVAIAVCDDLPLVNASIANNTPPDLAFVFDPSSMFWNTDFRFDVGSILLTAFLASSVVLEPVSLIALEIVFSNLESPALIRRSALSSILNRLANWSNSSFVI